MTDPPERAQKSPTAYRTIGEVSALLEVPTHVLRFWETRFPQISPLKRGGGRRYYDPADLDLLRRIRHLLYADGFSIRGALQRLEEQVQEGRIARVHTGRSIRKSKPVGRKQDDTEPLLFPLLTRAEARSTHRLPSRPESGASAGAAELREALLELRQELVSLRALLGGTADTALDVEIRRVAARRR